MCMMRLVSKLDANSVKITSITSKQTNIEFNATSTNIRYNHKISFIPRLRSNPSHK